GWARRPSGACAAPTSRRAARSGARHAALRSRTVTEGTGTGGQFAGVTPPIVHYPRPRRPTVRLTPMSDGAKPIRKAVIPVAGLGTRLLPATKAIPKEMLPVVDRPAIEYIVDEAVRAGLTDILMVTGKGKGAIEDHFDRHYQLEDALERKEDEERLARIRASAEIELHFI